MKGAIRQICILVAAAGHGLDGLQDLVIIPSGDDRSDELPWIAELADPPDHFQIKGIFIDLLFGGGQDDPDSPGVLAGQVAGLEIRLVP